ncbi:MAG: TIGR03435 family protein [Bryobacteraceae bacterium]
MTKALLFLAACTAWAQPKLAYDAASIKPSPPENPGMTRIMVGGGAGGRFSANGTTIRQLILQAYGLQDFQLTGGPGWIGNDRYDIEATPGAGISPTQEQNREMLQSLLEERFQLKVRRETKPMQGYSLVQAKNGSKMKASADQTPIGAGPGPGGPPGAVSFSVARPVGGGPAPALGAPPRGMIRMGQGEVFGQGMQLPMLVQMLSRQLGRPVVDNTGLTGLFDVELKWTPDRTSPQGQLPPGVVAPQIDPDGPTIFTALQEQLGLRLEATTQPGEMLTIERIERPSEN